MMKVIRRDVPEIYRRDGVLRNHEVVIMQSGVPSGKLGQDGGVHLHRGARRDPGDIIMNSHTITHGDLCSHPHSSIGRDLGDIIT